MSFDDDVKTGFVVVIILALVAYFGASLVVLAGGMTGYWQLTHERFGMFEIGIIIDILAILVIIAIVVLGAIGRLTNKYILKE